MDAFALTQAAFWGDARPLVLAGPRWAAEAAGLEERLAGAGWAQGGVVFASSGSTGHPKWVFLRKTALLASAAMVNRHLRVGEGDRWFLALPWWHVGGFGVAARAAEARCGFAESGGPWESGRFVREVADCAATCTSLVPTQVHDLVAGGHSAPSSLRAVVVGGGALRRETGQAARALGWPVLASYGMTEAGSQIATAPLCDLEREFRGDALPVLPGWKVGSAPDGRLRVKGAALFEGYVAEGGAVPRLVDGPQAGWFTTADIVEIGEDGLSFRRRGDRVVKILGELVDVAALEGRLQERAGARGEVCVVACGDARAGHRLCPVVVGEGEDWEGLVEGFNEGLPGHERLGKPLQVADLPRTALGKPDLEALRRSLERNSSS